MKEKISQESPLCLTLYKSSSLHSIPSLGLLAFIVSEKSLTMFYNGTSVERKKKRIKE